MALSQSRDLVGLAINPGARDITLPSAEELRALAPGWVRYLVSHAFQDFDTGRNTELDLVLERCAPLGINVLALINPETLNAIPPLDDPSRWSDYAARVADSARKLAAFYNHRLDAIEVFNEPDDQKIPPEDYAAILRVAYDAIKSVSRTPVILGGITGLRLDYLEHVAQAAPNAFDFAAYHPYAQRVDNFPAPGWGLADLHESLTRARQIAGKPLWLTEIGTPLRFDYPPGSAPEATIAEYLRRAFALLRELGREVVARAFWFTWKDFQGQFGYGLVDDAGNRRPAWYAFQEQTHDAPSATPRIDAVKFALTKVDQRDVLNVSITVTNASNETLVTQEPHPGYVYDEDETFYSRSFAEIPGMYRVGVDWDGREGIDHPYRWGFGAPLAPKETRVIVGGIRLRRAGTRDFWTGLVQEQIAWVQDRAGVTAITVDAPLQGAPRVVDVSFSPVALIPNQLLNVSITVRNDSSETLSTQAPDPGLIYDEGDTFYSRGFADVRRSYRVGVDFDARSGVDHPYRWGFGAPLAPGETRVITGAIRIKNVAAKKYWAGLVQEQSAWRDDKRGMQTVAVNPAGAPKIVAVAFTPTALNADEVMNVSITVKNDSAETLQTQGPDAGLVYEQGESFYARGFPDIRGSYRVGVDFDARSGIDHPYRWGLGTPLAPGETRVITGGIRLKRAQAQNYWAGLVSERVAWMQDRAGAQAIRVAAGAKPRVVHVHDARATHWDGVAGDYWNSVDQDVVNDMLARGLIALTGAANIADAWRKLIPHYQPGEAIAIKVNFANNGALGLVDSLPQTLHAIVRGLKQIGVREEDVWVYDTNRIPDYYALSGGVPGVKFFDVTPRLPITFDSADPLAVIAFAPPPDIPNIMRGMKIADALVYATYLINLPLFKGHVTGAGVTLGFKNHMGSTSNPSAFHAYVWPPPLGGYFRSEYNAFVDLNLTPHIRNKTVLTIGDGLFTGDRWNSPPLKMKTFGSQTPNSLFLSADPVAIDSVMYDFLAAEWELRAGADNYLRLASEMGLGVYERGEPQGSGYKQIAYVRV